jgi:methylphosphotriester-DNA--protein-cysteine methyltransferase
MPEPSASRSSGPIAPGRGSNLASKVVVVTGAARGIGRAIAGPRQFSRAFRNETGASPAKAIKSLRLEAVHLMIAQSRHPIEVVARETGFGDQERMRRAFVRVLGQSPQALRRVTTAERAEHVRMEET